MGQKVNPIGFRTGRTIGWKSRWFSDSANYKDFLIEDIKIRETLLKKLALAGINNIEIERLPKSIVIIVSVSRPGVVIGRGGSGIEDLKKEIVKIIKLNKNSSVASLKIDLKVNEIKSPELSAYLIAGRIVSDLERRIPHRRSITKAMDRVMMVQEELKLF